ncbi:MAG: tetratricopeptide repeat protein [Bryobacteraceae bacterium]|nr:tetratricopeptide repeat protein [Bryobacteraceae bacterium]
MPTYSAMLAPGAKPILFVTTASLLAVLATVPLYIWSGPEAVYASPPWLHHTTAIAVHLACGWLALGVFEKLLPARSAVVAAAIFLLHPAQVESVAAAEGLRPLIAALGALAAWRLWTAGRLWIAAAVSASASCVHIGAAGLPLALMALEWGMQRRRQTAWPLALTAVASAAALTLRGGVSFDFFAHQGVALLRALWVFMIPIGLAPVPGVEAPPLAASLAWGVIAVIAILSTRGVKAAQEGYWMLVALLLALPEFSAFGADDLASGRRFYLPLAAAAGLSGLALRKTPKPVLALLAILFAAITLSQTLMWRNETSLWMESARMSPGELRPRLELSRLLAPAQAVELMEDTRDQRPGDARVLAALAHAYSRAGRNEDARRTMESALRLAPCSHSARKTARLLGLNALPPCPSTSER